MSRYRCICFDYLEKVTYRVVNNQEDYEADAYHLRDFGVGTHHMAQPRCCLADSIRQCGQLVVDVVQLGVILLRIQVDIVGNIFERGNLVCQDVELVIIFLLKL